MKSADPEAAVTHRRNHRFSPEARQLTTTSSIDGNAHVFIRDLTTIQLAFDSDFVR